MQNKIIITFLCLILIQSFVKAQEKPSAYLSLQYVKTLNDETLGNNPWGAGLGLQVFLNNKSKFKITAELTGDIYLEDDKIFRLTPDSVSLNDIGTAINLLAGSSFHPTKNVYGSFLLGPSFINGKIFFGIKPSLGFFFSKKQRWTGRISYINVFNRIGKTDFSSVSLAIGHKLF
jgi:hypothetical protein